MNIKFNSYDTCYEITDEPRSSQMLYNTTPDQTVTIDIDNPDNLNFYLDFIREHNADIINDTMEFQKKYGLHDPSVYGFLETGKMNVKLSHLKEEMDEILKAYESRDLNEFCDGILDLVYVAVGTLNLMNMPVESLWNDIQIRNMQKIRATKETVGKRGSTFDVIKPEGWTGPITAKIIDSARP